MFAKLTALVSQSSLPFDVAGPYLPSGSSQWTRAQGTYHGQTSSNERAVSVSVFRIAGQSEDDPLLVQARNGVKRLKMLRHPNILRYIDTLEIQERGQHVVYLVTEKVSSLDETMGSVVSSMGRTDKEKYLMMGLEQITSAVSFLANDCGLIHGNICAHSVCVTPQLDWKLFFFDLTTEHALVGGAQYQSVPLVASSWMVQPQYKSGELGRSEWEVVADGPVWAVDAWGIGCLMQETFSGSLMAAKEDLKRIDCIPQTLKPYYQKLLATQPSRRMNPKDILDAGVLKSDLLLVVAFLQNLAVKDAMEKDAFFKSLQSKLNDVPDVIARKKILPLLASSLEYGGAPPSALSTLVSLSKTLTAEEKDSVVVPVIVKLFSSPDRGIRRTLLEKIHSFGLELSDALVEEQIYPKLQLGFTDANPYIRELTLKSMVILAPKLQQRTLNQNLLKYLAKLQVDEEPGIRANTTILLGTLATHFKPETRKKVLLNAMARAMRDPFPPARMAALRALQSTVALHDADDVATKVIPMISPLAVDGVQDVRITAVACLDEFFAVVKEHELQTRVEEEERLGSAGLIESGAMTGVRIETSPASAGVETIANAPPTQVREQPQQQFHHARDVSDLAAYGAPKLAATPHGLPTNPIASVKEEKTTLDERNGSSSTGWMEDDDVLEDMLDAAAAEREARTRLNALSVNKPASRGAARMGGTTESRPAKPVAARERRVQSSKSNVTKPKKPLRPMKLGATRVETTFDDDDDDFDAW